MAFITKLSSWLPDTIAGGLESHNTQKFREDLGLAASHAQVISLITLIASAILGTLALVHGGWFAFLAVPFFTFTGLFSYDFFKASEACIEVCKASRHFLFIDSQDEDATIRGAQKLANLIFPKTLILGKLANIAFGHMRKELRERTAS